VGFSKWKLTHNYTVSIKVLTEQKLSTSAVEAFLARFGVAEKSQSSCENSLRIDKLCYDTLTNFEALDLWSNSSLNFIVRKPSDMKS
jgi:hypothetical protein